MLTIDSLNLLSHDAQPLHLALGVFDGLHLGHQQVIQQAINAARQHGGLAGLLTFSPHPLTVLQPSKTPPSSLCHPETRNRILASMGLDVLILLPFTTTLATMPAVEFVQMLRHHQVRTLAVGEDWRFGHQRSGDVALLRSLAHTLDFQLHAVPPVTFNGERISSTRIRRAISSGDLHHAEHLLGRPYSVRGTVTRGAQLARSLGFPTANLTIHNAALPPDGVWVVEASSHISQHHPGIANLGFRPTVHGQSRVLETHLFDCSPNLYDSDLEVRFLHHLRKEIHFPNLEALKEQIQTDCASARAWFETYQPAAIT